MKRMVDPLLQDSINSGFDSRIAALENAPTAGTRLFVHNITFYSDELESPYYNVTLVVVSTNEYSYTSIGGVANDFKAGKVLYAKTGYVSGITPDLAYSTLLAIRDQGAGSYDMVGITHTASEYDTDTPALAVSGIIDTESIPTQRFDDIVDEL